MLLLKLLKISGHSMQPSIPNGSFVIISSIPFLMKEPAVGDVIAFQKNDKIMIKRITAKRDGKFKVAGDNILDSLEVGWVERKKIIGKLIFKI